MKCQVFSQNKKCCFCLKDCITHCISVSFLVKQKRSSLSETVVSVIDQEVEKIFNGKDSNTLNNEFLERNSNSVLHRAAGE